MTIRSYSHIEDSSRDPRLLVMISHMETEVDVLDAQLKPIEQQAAQML